MKNIMTLEEFLSQDGNLSEINEGLLSNLFGAIFRRDMWSAVQGEESIKREFREIDNKLDGFYLTKIKNPNVSQNVRQTLVDWAGDIYNAKVKAKEDLDKTDEFKKDKESLEASLAVMSVRAENEKELEGKISEETKKMLSSLKERIEANKQFSKILSKMEDEVKKTDDKYQKELDDLTSSSPDLKRWANILKNRMSGIIDKVLAGKYDEENKLAKDLEKLQKEKDEKMKKKNDEEAKVENEQLKKINDERNSVLKKCGAEITTEKSGVNFIKKIIEGCKTDALFEEKSVFDGKTKVNLEAYKKSGLEKLLGINVEKDNTSLFDALSSMNDVVIKTINNDFSKKDERGVSKIDGINGVSMQAFFVSYCNLLLACHTENKNLDDNLKTCMARCSVYNNPMVGFGLPCPDELDGKKDEEKVSMFVYYLDKTIKSWKEGSDVGGGGIRVKRLEQFRKEIQDKTEKLVDEYNKKQEQEAKKEEQEEKKEESK